ncbi:uncharacterized protein LOC130614284 [Hydractinia symbiolongicarpus]|uniref:uncharacterized protein LOC130614284 n=1 Tax=Hydractinia symbiolongicarpus TaxID=13093 RepID=UPI00254B1153|nr:uncharacterized protein LOC130614284 [Hydractinia symbiolongicarpus]
MTTLSAEDIIWSTDCLGLKAFVEKYSLPQIVQVDEGYYGTDNNDTFSSEQNLKLHSVNTIRKIMCEADNGFPYHIPVSIKEKVLLEKNTCVFKTVADLAKIGSLPPYVEVTNGYYVDNANGDDDYDIFLYEGEKIEIVPSDVPTGKYLMFQNSSGEQFQLPFSCDAGFIPLYHFNEMHLTDILPVGLDEAFTPFSFQFVRTGFSHYSVGTLHCKRIYEDEFITASSAFDDCQYVFSIPIDLQLVVKVASGTIENDEDYEKMRYGLNSFEGLEEECKERLNTQIFQSSTEVYGYIYANPRRLNAKTDSKTLPPRSPTQLDVKPVLLPRGKKHNVNPPVISRERKPSLYTSGKTLQGDSIRQKHKSLDRSQSTPAYDRYSKTELSTSYDYIYTEIPEQKPKVVTVKDMNAKTIGEVCDMLSYLKLDKHIDVFKSNQIDGALLCGLTIEDLKDIGLSGFEIKKIFRYRDGWRPKE